MSTFTKCEQCKAEIAEGECEFAIYSRVVDGKKHTFCCSKCAERFQKEKAAR